MTKEELVSEIAKKANVTKKRAEIMLNTVIEAIHKTLKEHGEIEVDQLGIFKVFERKVRTGFNPQTKAIITIPATKTPAFIASQTLKDIVNGI